MANLIVTYTTAFPSPPEKHLAPIMVGIVARTETLEIDTTSAVAVGTLLSVAGEDVVNLYAEADCWVAIGSGTPDPTAASDGTRAAHFVPSGQPTQFHVNPGVRVAVEQAA